LLKAFAKKSVVAPFFPDLPTAPKERSWRPQEREATSNWVSMADS